MAARQDKITIEVLDSVVKVGANEVAARLPHDAVLRLAQLIGRQIAREQFDRQCTKERRDDRKRARN